MQMWEKRICDIRVEALAAPQSQGELRIAVSYRIAGREEEDGVEVAL